MFQKKDLILSVYREKSFSKAAKDLYISQPALSATIKKVENQVGLQLFDRSSIPVTPTECGYEYIKAAEEITNIESKFKAYLNSIKSTKGGKITIGSTHLYISYIIPKIVSTFLSECPHVKVNMVESNSSDLEQKLLNGEVDIVIDNKELDPKSFNKGDIKAENLLLVIPKSYAINEKLKAFQLTSEDIKNNIHLHRDVKGVKISMFKDCQFILMNEGNDTRTKTDLIFKKENIKPNILFELNQIATLYNFVVNGMACSIVNDTVISKLSSEDNLYFYKLDAEHTERQIYYHLRGNTYINKTIERFIEAIDSIKYSL